MILQWNLFYSGILMDSQNKLPQETGDGSNTVITNLEELIKNHISRIDQLKTDSKNARSMLNDALTNDPVYKQHDDKAKEAAKLKNTTKKQIISSGELFKLSQKTKEISAQLKELKNGLSDYLHEFQRLSGANEITGSDGEIREIVFVARLVKKPHRNS